MDHVVTNKMFRVKDPILSKLLSAYSHVLILPSVGSDGHVELIVSGDPDRCVHKDKDVYEIQDKNGFVMPYLFKGCVGRKVFLYISSIKDFKDELFRIKPIDFFLQRKAKYKKKFPKIYPYFVKTSLIIPRVFVDPVSPNIVSFENTTLQYVKSGVIIITFEPVKVQGRSDMFRLKRYGVFGYRTSSIKVIVDLVEHCEKDINTFMYNGSSNNKFIFRESYEL